MSRGRPKKPVRYRTDVGSESDESGRSDHESEFHDSDSDRCSTPESQKNTKCSVCSLNVTSSHKSLQCDKCNEWCHIKCGGVTKEHYNQMVKLDESNIDISWHCPPCEKLEKLPEPPLKEKSVSMVTNNGDPLAMASNEAHIPRPGPTPPLANRQTVGTASSNRGRKPTTIVVSTTTRTTTTSTVRTVNGSGGRNAPGRLSFPDCRIRELPFYPSKATLLRPCNLTPKDGSGEAQQQNLAFYLTQDQANQVNNGRKVESNGMVVYKMHILLRFTKRSPDNVHDDDFPKNLCLKVNNKICPLPNPKPVPANRPNMEAKRPPKPLIITSLCKLNTKSCLNQIGITWTPTDVTHTVSIYLVEKLSPVDLLAALKERGQRDPEITKALIRSKLEDQDSDEIATTSCKVTMACPLGMARMTYPTRSSTCDHLQCFDADIYFRMNEKKPKWLCPVCNKPAYFDTLFLDGFYIQLLQSPQFRALSTNDIVLNQDATWEPVVSDGVGVSDNSSDDEDPLSLTRPTPVMPTKVTRQPEIIPITHEVDADGAPILSQLAALPLAARLSASAAAVAAAKAPAKEVDENFLADEDVMPEDDFADINFSIKFYQFIRTAPEAPEPTVAAAASAAKASQQIEEMLIDETPPPAVVVAKPKIGRAKAATAAPKPRGGRGGRGRRRGGAAQAKRGYDSDEQELSAEEIKKTTTTTKPKRGGGGGGGRAGGRGRGGNHSAPKKPRYREISEESSEDEEEVYHRPVATKSSRPSRNCRRSTNYADIEKAGDVLDYLLN